MAIDDLRQWAKFLSDAFAKWNLIVEAWTWQLLLLKTRYLSSMYHFLIKTKDLLKSVQIGVLNLILDATDRKRPPLRHRSLIIQVVIIFFNLKKKKTVKFQITCIELLISWLYVQKRIRKCVRKLAAFWIKENTFFVSRLIYKLFLNTVVQGRPSTYKGAKMLEKHFFKLKKKKPFRPRPLPYKVRTLLQTFLEHSYFFMLKMYWL